MSAESFEEREARLHPRRERLAAESSEEREARLHPQHERLAAESSEEREARLQSRRERLAAESSEEREARLYIQLRREQLAAESSEEREARLQSRRERLAATTSTVQRCTLQPTTWTQAPYHLSYRLFMYTYILHVLDYHLKCWLLLCSWYNYANLDLVGINSGGRDANFWCATHHVAVSSTTRTICLQWTCNQSATRRSLLRQLVASTAKWTWHHCGQERRSSQHPSWVRRGVVLHALQWLLAITTGTTSMFASTLMPSLCFQRMGTWLDCAQ